ncbi:MAG: hypothetical protein QOF92_4677 [Pseudonocardiales bacterium]|jgi:biotin carboxylase|nr:hypothetical protein [Pseudonocardiales bacterium]
MSHIVIINRWREAYADYAAYLDHGADVVSYITTEVGLGSVPDDARGIAIVDATDDLAQVRRALEALVERHGAPDRIVGLKEDDLLIAAALRRDWDLPGHSTLDLMRFRDKFIMCRTILEAGLPVPAFAAAAGPADVLTFAESAQWPLILKPRIGSSSDGVVKLNSAAELESLVWPDQPMMVQAFNAGPIYHVDGVFTGRELLCWRASRYTNTCLDFRSGRMLGSVEEDDPRTNEAIESATTAFLAALTTKPTAFHLEVFVESSSDTVTCSFLEVGARVGGAEIPFIWRDLHGYDLMEAAFRLQLGLRPADPAPLDDDRTVGGWLLIPAPAVRPCLITEATSMVSRRPGPYAETLLRPGEVLPAADAYYEHVGGRFRFRGSSSADVEAAILATAAAFRVSGEPLAA